MDEVIRGIWVIAYREILRFVQERSRIISSFGMPLLFLVIFGAGFNRVIGSLAPDVDFIKFIYPGIIAMTVLMTSVFSGVSVVWDREFGFLKEVLVAPLSRTGVLLGKALGGAIVATGQAIILLAIAPFIGISLNPVIVVALIPLVLVISMALAGVGLLIASRMRSQQGFHMVMQLLIFPLIFLSGVFFPVNDVPEWLQVVVKANPITYGVDAIRQLFLNGNLASAATGASSDTSAILGVTVFGHTMGIVEDLIVVCAIGAVLMAAAMWSFNRQE